MKSYDDLQRFREKTQTNHIEFRDMSEQSSSSGTASWAIIRQLVQTPTDGALEGVQHITRGVPQPVDPQAFTAAGPADALVSPTVASATTIPQSTFTPVSSPAGSGLSHSAAAAPAGKAYGLLDSVAQSLPAAPAAQAVPGAALLDAIAQSLPAAPATQAAPGAALLDAVAQSLPAAPAAQAAAFPPDAMASPLRQMAFAPDSAAPGGRFRQLFSAGVAPGSPSPDAKQTLLQPLLEKIASCR